MKTVAFRVLITGRVQGVGYRASTVKAALSLGLTGWARNLKDGSVEILAQGPDDRIRSLIEWCRQGPPRARVTDVEIHPVPWDPSLKTFQIGT